MKARQAVHIAAGMMLAAVLVTDAAEPVSGRYVVYGNGLSQILGVAEFEVWSGGKNIVAGQPESFALLCLSDRDQAAVEARFRNLVDGDSDVLKRWPYTFEINAKGMGYSDGSLSHAAFEVDLGRTVAIERLDIYRSRMLFSGRFHRMFGDLGWRYLLVLDEDRKIVSYEAWNVYFGDYKQHQNHFSFEPKPATGAPAGRHVPEGSLSWLSEAEYIRDFLGKPVIDKADDLTPEAQARLAAFSRRNSPEAIDALGRTFFAVVDLDRPGMAAVKTFVDQERYAEAFDAVKTPLFETFAALDIVYSKFEYTWYTDPNSRVGMRARDLLNHVYADKKARTVTRFTPGLLPPAKLQFPFQMRPLLLSYVATGDISYLRAWEAMTDDWALGFQDAGDRDPKAVRDHFVLNAKFTASNLLDLLNASRDNPDFVDDVSGATIARFLLPIVEEMPVANWRVVRKVVFNHVFNAVTGGWSLSQGLADFYAGQRLEQEMRHVMLRMYTLGLYRDGPMIEIGDEGHMQGVAASPANLFGMFAEHPEFRPDWFTPAFEAYYLDHLRRSELASFCHISPDGTGIRTAPRRYVFPAGINNWSDYPDFGTSRDKNPVVAGVLQRHSVAMEPDPRLIADRVYGWGVAAQRLDTKETRALADYDRLAGRYHRPPEIVSDWLPYAGCWYFRRGWEATDSFLHMLKQPIRNILHNGWWNPHYGHLGQERFVNSQTAYRLRDYATSLITVLATEVDRQPPCNYDGYIFSGSKQDIFSQGVEKPQPMRWYTDDTLDFGEAEFSGRYMTIYRYPPEHPKTPVKSDQEYVPSETIVEGVATTRQILQIRPMRLFLQLDRLKYADAEEAHANRIPLHFVLTEPGAETEKAFSDDQLQLDAPHHTVTMRNPGNPGVTYALFGQDITFQPYSINGAEYNYFPWPDPEEVDPKRDAMMNNDNRGQGFSTLNGPRRTTGRGVFANWQSTGSTAILAAVYATKPGEEPIRRPVDKSNDSCIGAYLADSKGNAVTLLAARRSSAKLQTKGIVVDGEALMLLEQRGRRTVLVLGAASLTIDDQTIDLPTPNAVFDLNLQSSICNLQSILRPLDPPTIHPGVNVFTDTTTVSITTGTPGAVIKYTTRPPKSRLDDFKRMAELVRKGKLTYTEAAERLVLREEEGDTWQVYTGPFEITKDTLVRARTFRTGDEVVPRLRAAGTDVSLISYGFFAREQPRPSVGSIFTRTKPGLRYDYLEDRWFALWSHTDQLVPAGTGTVEELLDVSMRATDGPFGVRYHGYIDIPRDGVYTFYGPDEFINNTCAPGYDLRVFIDGAEWDLAQVWHARGTWSVPLEKGLHTFRVTFADSRAKDIDNQRVDLWRNYPHPTTTWRGTAPVLEVSGPTLARQPIPKSWLRRKN